MKKRADILLVEKGFFKSREKAKVCIMAGKVIIGSERVVKPSQKFSDEAEIKIIKDKNKYVSRGGLKLEGAIKDFNLDIKDKKCLDIGASTGGFTHCLLKMGANRVISLDVGRNLIDYNLRTNPKVLIVEGFNARFIDGYLPPFKVDLITIDVSFISAIKILKPLAKIIDDETEILILLKPQFELEKPFKGFNGVISCEEKHVEIIIGFYSKLNQIGYYVKDHSFSKLRGPKGNIEFFSRLGYGESNIHVEKNSVLTPYELVRNAHSYFNVK